MRKLTSFGVFSCYSTAEDLKSSATKIQASMLLIGISLIATIISSA